MQPRLPILIALAALPGMTCSPDPERSVDFRPRVVHLTEMTGSAAYDRPGSKLPSAGLRGPHFSFDNGLEGWMTHGPVNLTVSDGKITIRGDLSEGILMSPEMEIPLQDLEEMTLRLRSPTSTRVRLFWAESATDFMDFWVGTGNLSLSERLHLFRSHEVRVPPSDKLLPLRIPLQGLEPPGWMGSTSRRPVLRRLILQFPGLVSGEIEMDDIHLFTFGEHHEKAGFGVTTRTIAGVTRESIVLQAPGRLRFPLSIAKGASLRMSVSAPAAAGPLEFRLERPPGTTVYREQIPAGPDWHPIALDIPPGPDGSPGFAISLRTDSDATVFLGSPILLEGTGKSPPRRVILYLADAMSARHMGSYGYKVNTTPVLDRLAAGGALFLDCVSQSAWTRPSIVSILTGLYPPAHGVISWSDRLPPAVQTLAESFRREGFFTISFITNPNAGVSTGLDQGFDAVFETPAITGPFLEGEEIPGAGLLSSGTSLAINDQFFPWLKRNHDLPAFIYLHSMDPHFPYQPPPPFERGLGGSALPGEDRAMARRRSLYDGDIAFNDRQIGRILDLLELLGGKEETLLVVTSDHGEEFGEHGGIGHRNHLHGVATHVPLILFQPQLIPAGVRITGRVETIDILPTILDLLGLPIPEQVEGRSLVPSLHGGELPEKPAYSHLVRREAAEDRDGLRRADPIGEIALWQGSWLFMHGDYSPRHPAWDRLYDLDADPGEQIDVGGRHPGKVARFRQQCLEWYREQARRGKSWERTYKQVDLDAETERRLRALGYLQ